MVEELLKLETSQLLKSEYIEAIQKETDRIIRQFDVKGASQLSRFLGSKISEDSSLIKIYKDIIAKLDFIRIGLVDENEVLSLIRNHFALIFLFPLDILAPIDIIQRRLISASLIDQELLREKINKAIKENNNLLTKEKLTLTSRKEKVEPTITNWLLDYDLRLTEAKDRPLARAEYLTNSPNIINLSEEEKEKIEELIKVYDFINTSSLIPSASPEDLIVNWENGCRFIMSEGETIASLPPIKEGAALSKDLKVKKETNIKTDSGTADFFEQKYLEEESDVNDEE